MTTADAEALRTPARRIDGKYYAAKLLENLAAETAELKAQGCDPTLAVILVGEDPASAVYVRNKVRQAEATGIRSLEYRLEADTTQQALLAVIETLNQDPLVHGILVQLPLPPTIDEQSVISAIRPSKDVDGFHHENVGGLVLGQQVLAPCTPTGCLRLLSEECGDLSGLHAVIIGRSNIVGKPMASLLLQAHCSVTVLHSRSKNAAAIAKQADILVIAVGIPGLVTADWVKPGAVVIDVGINRIVTASGKSVLTGDANYCEVSKVAAALTPVPGGVGPMTIACLMENTLRAARYQLMSGMLSPTR